MFAFKQATPHNNNNEKRKPNEKQAAYKTKLHHLLPQPVSHITTERVKTFTDIPITQIQLN